MCGITGVLGRVTAPLIDAMTDAIASRGPDGRGTWMGPDVGLGARRLAIVDVAGGAQPMRAGDHVLVANGEIYNHRALRRSLESAGDTFRTDCDVEVLLHGLRRFGPAFLTRLRGFFAFALWDSKRRELLLGRDRFGIAPLVWTEAGGVFAFASEVKAFEHLPGWEARLNANALNDYLTHRYAMGPETFFAGVHHLSPGTWMRVDSAGRRRTATWYALPEIGAEVLAPKEATERLRAALDVAVARRRQGEGEVGLYLSGGLDSSLIAAISAGQRHGLRAYTHGFDGALDETDAARRVARELDTPLHMAQIRPDDINALPQIVRAMEQPVANSDVVGLWVLAARASRDVKAVICGEGADELFGSYPHQQALSTLSAVPDVALKTAKGLVGATPAWLLSRFSRYTGAAADPRVRQRLRATLATTSLSGRYEGLVALFSDVDREVLLAEPWFRQHVSARRQLIARLDVDQGAPLERLISMKFASWLPDYHLGRENRIAMAFGMEARYPFLDVDVVEAVHPLTLAHKVGWAPPREKRLLRQVARQVLPRRVANQPKGPVRVPVDLFGARFHEMAADTLCAQGSPLVESDTLRGLLREARTGSFLAGRQVFALLMFECWRKEWRVSCD